MWLDSHLDHVAIILLQLVVGILLVLRSCVLSLMGWSTVCEGLHKSGDRSVERAEGRGLVKPDDSGEESTGTDMTDDIQDHLGSIHHTLYSELVGRQRVAHGEGSALVSSMREREKHHQWQKERRRAFELGRPIFLSHTRTEQNFLRGSDDPQIVLPPSSPMEIEPAYYTRLVLYGYMRHSHMFNLILLSLGWSLIAGGFGSTLSLYYYIYVDDAKAWMKNIHGALPRLLSDFKWLPTFMLSFHLSFYVQRWRQFIFAAWGVEGRLKDLGIIIGSDAQDPDDPATRRLMYKIYRYMVLSMALQYKIVLPPLKDAGPNLCKMLEGLGLLTPEEALVLAPQGSRMRDAVLSWIALEVKDNGPAKSGLLYGGSQVSIMDKLTALRAKMMYFHGNAFYPQPNLWNAFMTVLIDVYCGLMIIVYPFKMFTPLRSSVLHGFQLFTVMSVFLMTLCFWGADSMSYALSRPFAGRIDTFNIDALIAGTEQTLFASMRAGFDSTARNRRLKEA
mmetsp:Transcript_126663/g.370077  ORF Transcript_126663/g.370077 Transcript_126663/m.370077 type:complete len:504 (+) Transcript_126663:88-1599(+)